jgi:hypothetical protein
VLVVRVGSLWKQTPDGTAAWGSLLVSFVTLHKNEALLCLLGAQFLPHESPPQQQTASIHSHCNTQLKGLPNCACWNNCRFLHVLLLNMKCVLKWWFLTAKSKCVIQKGKLVSCTSPNYGKKLKSTGVIFTQFTEQLKFLSHVFCPWLTDSSHFFPTIIWCHYVSIQV